MNQFNICCRYQLVAFVASKYLHTWACLHPKVLYASLYLCSRPEVRKISSLFNVFLSMKYFSFVKYLYLCTSDLNPLKMMVHLLSGWKFFYQYCNPFKYKYLAPHLTDSISIIDAMQWYRSVIRRWYETEDDGASMKGDYFTAVSMMIVKKILFVVKD